MRKTTRLDQPHSRPFTEGCSSSTREGEGRAGGAGPAGEEDEDDASDAVSSEDEEQDTRLGLVATLVVSGL